MALAQDAAAVSGELPGATGGDSSGAEQEKTPETESSEEQPSQPPADGGGDDASDQEVAPLSAQESDIVESPNSDRSQPDTAVSSADPPSDPPSAESDDKSTVATQALEKELAALLSLGADEPPPHDVLMIQSEPEGTVSVVKADERPAEGKAPPPPLTPAVTWTSANLREFKHRMAGEKHGQLTVRRGEVMTIRVPTHPDGKRLCWEFATDDYDIGFGIYFDWTPVTSTAVTLQVSESSDEEEEEEPESPWHSREGDVERGSVYRLRSRYGEIMQVYRRDSHREVQAGSHEYPGEGIYLLKLDNSYSLMRSKTLYFHVYYSS